MNDDIPISRRLANIATGIFTGFVLADIVHGGPIGWWFYAIPAFVFSVSLLEYQREARDAEV